ncbi:hypothetical protein [Rhizobium redzepovicii]|uniref:hypothetical protein n=1 Tax=Rhizobium redzepovicii TaxID=2867518 RepID=UPI002870FE89|nr:hypothetical protein [Rhizobium redzepovicii]MDR9782276.1 hypothetical protein [Rhizobium redzepovicii]
MIFTNLAKIVAWLALVLGAFQLAIGLGVATGLLEPSALPRYAPGPSSGKVIDHALYQIIFAIALGALAEISLNVRRSKE